MTRATTEQKALTKKAARHLRKARALDLRIAAFPSTRLRDQGALRELVHERDREFALYSFTHNLRNS